MNAFKKMQRGTFDLDDMLEQMHQIKKLGPLSGVMKMIPGMPKMPEINDEDTDIRLKLVESIIYSMTKAERRDPSILNAKRKERIAKGSGRTVADVNRLLKQFEQSKQMMKKFSNMDPNTGMPTKSRGNMFNPNRKKVRHKKKKKR